jgi:hypothetical protein
MKGGRNLVHFYFYNVYFECKQTVIIRSKSRLKKLAVSPSRNVVRLDRPPKIGAATQGGAVHPSTDTDIPESVSFYWSTNLKRGGQGPIWAVGPLDGWMDTPTKASFFYIFNVQKNT